MASLPVPHQGDEHARNAESVRSAPTNPWPLGAPRLSKAYLSRPRLLDRLVADESIPLRLIQAPSGYGKTSLLAEWVRASHDTRAVWITLDDDINTRLGFWAAVTELLASAGLPDSSGFRAVDTRADVTSALSGSLHRAFQALDRPITLVIDAFERVTDASLEDDLIRLALHNDNLQLVIGTRRASKISSLETTLALTTVLIDKHDLEFRPDEIAQLAEQLGRPLSQRLANGLHESTSGWPFAIRAALHLPARSAQHPDAIAEENYGVAQLQRQLLRELMDDPRFPYLATVSVVDSFTADQAIALGAAESDSSILNEIESRGLGSWEGDGAPLRFRMQPLLRQVLRATLTDQHNKHIHTRLTHWFEKQEDYGHAFQAAIAAHEWAAARRCIRRGYTSVVGLLSKNPEVMADVPRSVIRSEPLIGLLCGIAHYMAGNTGKAVVTLGAAIAGAEQQRLARRDSITVDQVWVQGALTTGMRLLGRYELVTPALRRFQNMLAEVNDPDDELKYSDGLFQVETANTYIYLDRLADAEQVLGETRITGKSKRSHFYPDALSLFVVASQGRITETRDRIGDFSALLPHRFTDSFYSIPLHLAAARLHLEDGEPEAARRELSFTDSHWSTTENWPHILHTRSLTDWFEHGPTTALQSLDQGIAEKKGRPPVAPAMSTMLTALRADLLLASSRVTEARELVKSRKSRTYPRLAVSKARLLLLTGQREQTIALANAEAGTRRVTLRDQMHFCTIAAIAALHSDDAAEASIWFTRAVDLGERTGLRSPFAAMPRQDFTTLAEAVGLDEAIRQDVARLPHLFPERDRLEPLTRRELVVLSELRTSATIAEIAAKLSVSTNTIKTQCRMIYRKLGVSQRSEAVAKAQMLGLL